MNRKLFPILSAILVVQGCTALDLAELKPTGASMTNCKTTTNLPASTSPPPPGAGPTSATTYGPWELPRLATRLPGAAPSRITFADYVVTSRSALDNLPPAIRDHEVTQALFINLLKASASARLTSGQSSPPPGSGVDDYLSLKSEVDSYPASSKLTYTQLKSFARTVFDLQLNPHLVAGAPPGASPARSEMFSAYFRSYYEGTFVDRFGKKLQKPSISTSIPIAVTITDAEIAAAETVILEFLFDLIDPTPVLGDARDFNSVDKNTKFYPGGTVDSKPTSVITGVSSYSSILPDGCGVTTNNIVYLVDIAEAASDRAAAIGGLTFNSAGGYGFSFGVFGKLSIGDNQTLSTLAKTAVSRFAKRASYAATYSAIRKIDRTLDAPGAGPGEPRLIFP